MAEHYVLDLLVGMLCAGAVYLVSRPLGKRALRLERSAPAR